MRSAVVVRSVRVRSLTESQSEGRHATNPISKHSTPHLVTEVCTSSNLRKLTIYPALLLAFLISQSIPSIILSFPSVTFSSFLACLFMSCFAKSVLLSRRLGTYSAYPRNHLSKRSNGARAPRTNAREERRQEEEGEGRKKRREKPEKPSPAMMSNWKERRVASERALSNARPSQE